MKADTFDVDGKPVSTDGLDKCIRGEQKMIAKERSNMYGRTKRPNNYARGEHGIQALYVVKNKKDEEVYGPENFKSCSEEARRLSMCTGIMHRVVRI